MDRLFTVTEKEVWHLYARDRKPIISSDWVP